MKNLGVIGVIGVIGIIALIILIVTLLPMLFIYVINSLAVAGGILFVLEHTVWNYFLVLLLIIIRGN